MRNEKNETTTLPVQMESRTDKVQINRSEKVTGKRSKVINKQLLMLNDSTAITGFVRENWDQVTMDKFESFYVLYTDANKILIEWQLFNKGSANSVDVCINKLLKHAIAVDAQNIVVAHNHPSGGNTNPSSADISTTKILYKKCKALGINLIDHIIVSPVCESYSFFEKGMLSKYDKEIKEFEDFSTSGTYSFISRKIIEEHSRSIEVTANLDYVNQQTLEKLNKLHIKFFDPIVKQSLNRF